MKTTLSVISGFTLCAAVYLSLSLLVLHPGPINRQEWVLALIAAQSGLTLLALFAGNKAFRYLALIGGAGIIWAGATAINATLSGRHFEGYALVLGAAIFLQGVLTVIRFALQPKDP